jgi:mannosyltransferase OCH1-like enzyme
MKNSKYYSIVFCIILIIILVILIKKEKSNSIEYIPSTEIFEVPFYIQGTSSKTSKSESNVPLVIYQSWSTNYVPTKMYATIQKLISVNHEFDYYLYSDDASRKFIKENYDEEVLNAFDTLKPGAYKSDLWRYCILYKRGGVYLDIKYYSLVPLLPIINNNPIIYVKDLAFSYGFSEAIYNAFMVSPPNNLIFKYCIDDIVNSCRLKLYFITAVDITGPRLLKKILEKHAEPGYEKRIKFQFSRDSIINKSVKDRNERILYNNIEIFAGYSEYRAEQKLFQNGEHYDSLWQKRDVYN